MLLDISLRKAVNLVGHPGKTDIKDLQRALESEGVAVSKSITRWRSGDPLPDFCLVTSQGQNPEFVDFRFGHWMIFFDGQLWCPSEGVYRPHLLGKSIVNYDFRVSNVQRIVGYAEIY